MSSLFEFLKYIHKRIYHLKFNKKKTNFIAKVYILVYYVKIPLRFINYSKNSIYRNRIKFQRKIVEACYELYDLHNRSSCNC